ncbi:mitochondrial membrane protease, subunit 2 [Theileria orientalis]|uniref:Mitochondrial membrane protease, subunit 2 n=1 Tax=Theileria orientalis TaxID=68886 RepID=A0A976QUA4_THEOR|nr:mitochondrial membrane protease, subunit 2 [Theileria orientalis]
MALNRMKRLGSLVKSVAYTVAGVHIVTNYVVDATLTKGPSMSPEISASGALVFYTPPYLLSRLRHDKPLYRKDDIVISISPLNPNKRICKRIVGVPGEMVSNTMIPPGHFWIQGDNKQNSLDSRHYGAVSSGLFQGRVFLVLSREDGAKVL